MHDFLMTQDNKLWDIMLNGPHVPTLEVKKGDITVIVPKTQKQYVDAIGRRLKKDYKAKKFCFVELELKNTIESQLVSQQKRFGITYVLFMKALSKLRIQR